MSESEETWSSTLGFDAFKGDVDQICQQLDVLLEENTALDEGHRLPVTEFTFNPQRLISLQETLIQSELKVVRDVERERLDKLLQCHFLKSSAWDEMRIRSKSLFCIMCDACVRNYPIREPEEKSWRKIMEAVSFRLRELESRRGIDSTFGKNKTTVSKKTSPIDSSGVGSKGPHESLDTSKSTGSIIEEEEDLEDLELEEDIYKDLLYPQTELINRERVERQLILIKFMIRKLKDAFNSRFDSVHQRKGKVIEEVKRLTKRKRQLKEELTAVKQEQSEKQESGSRGMSLGVGGTGGSSRSLSDSGRPASALPEDEEDRDYDPQWRSEEQPELLLHVSDSEITVDLRSEAGTATPSTARAASAVEGKKGGGEMEGHQTTRSSTHSASGAPPSVGSDVNWTEARSAFLAGPRPHKNKAAKTPAGPGSKAPKDWTWAEARAWREWRAAQEEELRKRRAHVNTLNLQLERITPTIKSLLLEFDSQVTGLIESRVSTDEALLLYQLVTSRLQHRLHHQYDLQMKLVELQKQRKQVESKLAQVDSEAEGSRREEARAKAKHERLVEQLKDEETSLRRVLINLPIDQYNHLLALYIKRPTINVRHLDLPSARGGVTGSPIPSPGGRPLSPAPPNGNLSGRRGSVRHSRPPSSTSRSDEQRNEEDQMPEGLTGGVRTWRQFQKYRKRRQELQEEAEDSSSKKAAATGNLQAMDAHRQTLLQEAQKIDEAVSEVTDELTRLDLDMELVLVLRNGQVKIDVEEVTRTLRPVFNDTRLVPKEELDDLEMTIQKCGGEAQLNSSSDDGAGSGTEDAEVKALRILRGQLELQVELARQDLHHINNFKVGKDVMVAASEVIDGGPKQDSTQLYASLQRLQQLHNDRSRGISTASSDLNRKVDKTRKRVGSLQQEVEALAGEIDNLQTQVTEAQPEMAVIERENRLRRVMVCSDLASQTRRRQAAILDLQHELETLRLKTFPMLSRPPGNPS